MSDLPLDEEIVRIRARRDAVINLLAQEKQRQDSPDPHVRAAIAEVTKRLWAEKGALTDEIIAKLRAQLETTADRITGALGLSGQQADGYRSGTSTAVAHALREAERKRSSLPQDDPEAEIQELFRAINGQRDLLRWIEEAKGG